MAIDVNLFEEMAMSMRRPADRCHSDQNLIAVRTAGCSDPSLIRFLDTAMESKNNSSEMTKFE